MHSSRDVGVHDRGVSSTGDIETDPVMHRRLDRIYDNVRKIKQSEDIKNFVFNHGFDGDHGLGTGLNQSCVDFVLWLVNDYYNLVHLFRCGVKGGDQVERVAKRLYDGGFFRDIHKYIGKDFLFLESLPTADSVANPRGDIHYVESHNLFSESKKGFIGAAVLRTQRNSPWNEVVPSETVTDHPMETIFFENENWSNRDKIGQFVKSGRVAYKTLFKRMKSENLEHQNGPMEASKGLSADISVPVTARDGSIVYNIFEHLFPGPKDYNQLVWCMNTTFRYLVDRRVPNDRYYYFKELRMANIPRWYIERFYEEGELSDTDRKKFDSYRWKKLKSKLSVVNQCKKMAETRYWDDAEMRIFSVLFNLRFTVYDYDEDGNIKQKAVYEPDYEGAHVQFNGKTKSEYEPIDIRILEEPDKDNEGVLTGDFVYCVLLFKEAASSMFGQQSTGMNDLSEERVRLVVKEREAKQKQEITRTHKTLARKKEERDLVEREQKTAELQKKTKKHLDEKRASEKIEVVADLESYHDTVDIFSDPLMPRTLDNMVTFTDGQLSEFWAKSWKLNHTSESTIRPIYEVIQADPVFYQNLEGYSINDEIEKRTFTGGILKIDSTAVIIFVSSTVNKIRFFFDYLLDKMHNKGKGYNEITPSTYDNIPDDAYNVFHVDLEEQKQKLRYACYDSLEIKNIQAIISCSENASYLVVKINNIKTKKYLKDFATPGQVWRQELLNVRWEGIYKITLVILGDTMRYYYRQSKSSNVNLSHEVPYYIWVEISPNADGTRDMYLLDQIQHEKYISSLRRHYENNKQSEIQPKKYDGFGRLPGLSTLAMSALETFHTFVNKDVDQIKRETNTVLDNDIVELRIKTKFMQDDIEIDKTDLANPTVRIHEDQHAPEFKSFTHDRYTLHYDRDEDETKTTNETKKSLLVKYEQMKDKALWWFMQMQCKLKNTSWSPPQVLSDKQHWEFLGPYPSIVIDSSFEKIKKVMKIDGRHWFENDKLFFESNKTRQNGIKTDFGRFLKVSSRTTTFENYLKSQIGSQMFELKEFNVFKKIFLTPRPNSGDHIIDYESLAPKAKTFVRLCASVWISLLSLYLQSDLFIKLKRNQMWLLDNIFTKCPDFKGFVIYVDRLVASTAIKELIPDDSSFPEIVETWEFDDNGILEKATLKCASVNITEQIKALNQMLMSRFKAYKDTSSHQNVCFQVTFNFIDAVAKHAKQISKFKSYTRPSMNTSGGITVTYSSYSKAADNSYEYDFSTNKAQNTFQVYDQTSLLRKLTGSISEFECFMTLRQIVETKNVDTHVICPVPIMYHVWSTVWLEMLMKLHSTKIEAAVRKIKRKFDNEVERGLLHHAETYNARDQVYSTLHKYRTVDLNGSERFMNKLDFKNAVINELSSKELDKNKWKMDGERNRHERLEDENWNYAMLPQALHRVKRIINDFIGIRTFSWKLSWNSTIEKCSHIVFPDDPDFARMYCDSAIEMCEKWINKAYENIESNTIISLNRDILNAINFDFSEVEIESTLRKIIKDLTTSAYERQFEWIRTMKSKSDELSGAYNSINVHKLKVKMDQRLQLSPPSIEMVLPPYVKRLQLELSKKYFVAQVDTSVTASTNSTVRSRLKIPGPVKHANKFELLQEIDEEDEDERETEENLGVSKPILDVSELENVDVQWKDDTDVAAIARELAIENFVRQKMFCPLINDRYSPGPMPTTGDVLQNGLIRLNNACLRVSTKIMICTEFVDYKICDGLMYDKTKIKPQHECVFFVVRPVLLLKGRRLISEFHVLLQYMKAKSKDSRETLHIFIMSEDYDENVMWQFKTLCMIFFRLPDENQVNIVQLNEFKKSVGMTIRSDIVMLWIAELFAGNYFGEPLWIIDLINQEVLDMLDTVLYWNCIEYKLSRYAITPTVSCAIGTAFEFGYLCKRTHTFLSIEKIDDATQKLDHDQMIVGIASALNLDIELFAPYQDHRYTIDEQSDSNKIYSLALDNSYHLSYGSQMSFYKVNDKLCAQPSLLSGGISTQSKDLIAMHSTRTTQKLIKNKLPQYFITYIRDTAGVLSNIYENQSCFEKSSDGSFFKSLAANGYYHDENMALNEFYLCMVAHMDEIFTFKDMHKAPEYLQARADEMFVIFEEGFELEAKSKQLSSQYPNMSEQELEDIKNQNKQHILKEFQSLGAMEIFMIYWHILKDPSFAPSPQELTILCNKLKAAILIFKDDVSTEFGNISNSTQDRYIPTEYNSDVIAILYQPKIDVYSRLVLLKRKTPLVHSTHMGHEVTELYMSTNSVVGEKFTGKYISIHSFEYTGQDGHKKTEYENIIMKSIEAQEHLDVYVLNTYEYFLWRFSDSWYIGTTGYIQRLLRVLTEDSSNGLADGLRYTYKLHQTDDPRGTHEWKPHPSQKITQKTILISDESEIIATESTTTSNGGTEGESEFTTDGVMEDIPITHSTMNQGNKIERLPVYMQYIPGNWGENKYTVRETSIFYNPDEQVYNPMILWKASAKNTDQDEDFQKLSDTIVKFQEEEDTSKTDEDPSETMRARRARLLREQISEQRRGNFGPAWTDDEADIIGGRGNRNGGGGGGGGGGSGSFIRELGLVLMGGSNDGTGVGGGWSKTGGGGGGGKKKGKARQGTHGAQRICVNRKNAREQREEQWNWEGDSKTALPSNDYDEYDVPIRGNKSWKTPRSNRTESEFFMGTILEPPPQPHLNNQDGMIVDEDNKPDYMLTSAVAGTMLTLEMFNQNDTATIKIIPGLDHKCRTLALFISCFFKVSMFLDMFDVFTDNITVAGKGLLKDMAVECRAVELLENASDLTDKQFEILDKKVEILWEKRRRYFNPGEDEMSLEELKEDIEDKSSKLWWAHHRCLTIAATAFIEWAETGIVKPSKYITRLEANMTMRIMEKHGNKDLSRTLLENIRNTPYGQQLKPLLHLVANPNAIIGVSDRFGIHALMHKLRDAQRRLELIE